MTFTQNNRRVLETRRPQLIAHKWQVLGQTKRQQGIPITHLKTSFGVGPGKIQHKFLSVWASTPKLDSFPLTHLTPNNHYSGRTAPLTSKAAFYMFTQQIQVLNILNMVYTLRFFSSKCSLFHNSNVFGSCIIHILYTGCAKI